MSSASYCPKTAAAPDKNCRLFVKKDGQPVAAYVPIEPLPVLGKTLLAHEYSVCGECFTGQFERKYKQKPKGVEPW